MIWEQLVQRAKRDPSAVALVDGDAVVSYSELTSRAANFASFMTRRLALGPGEVIAFFLPNCWEFVAGFFATARVGAVCMPFNLGWRASELKWYAERYSIAAVVTNRLLRRPWDELSELIPVERVIEVDEPGIAAMLTSKPSRPPVRRGNGAHAKRVALHLTTSGSTGRPKVALRTQEGMIAGARNVGTAIGIKAGQRVLAAVPFYHANGFSNSMLLPLMHGATVVLMRKFEPRKFAAIADLHKIQVIVASPVILQLIADRDFDSQAFSFVETCLSSGAATPAALVVQWKDRFGVRVRQLYGSSETGTISIEATDSPIGEQASGKLVPSVEVKILDRMRAQAGVDEIGEIVVRTPAMMPQELVDRDLSPSVFAEGFFRTGDLGKLDAEGNLVVVGRRKRMINVGGTKVDPEEVENAIQKIPGVRLCRVLAAVDRRQSEMIKAVIVVEGEQTILRQDVIQHCRQSLAEYKIPRAIDFVADLPCDLTGKQAEAWRIGADELSSTQD
jgi:long-chain acyl-CoA synthetase